MSQFSYLNFLTLILCFCCLSGSVYSQQWNDYPNSGSEKGLMGSPYFYYQQPQYPRDCTEVTALCSSNNVSGVYSIQPVGYPEPFEVYCDNTVDSGGWTVIYRIHGGSILSDRNWTEYKTGFGFLSQEFWLGNDKLSFLTNQNTYELRIDVTSADGLSFYVTYNKFRISDEYSDYTLTSVGEYDGTEDEINRFLCPSNREGTVYVYPGCLKRCSCAQGGFACDAYQCSPNAVCERRDNVLQCYCNAGYKGDGVNCTIDIPSDCQDVYDRVSTESGTFKIKPAMWQGDPFDVYCNMTDGGGWTVFQRRVDGSQDFHLFWSHYKNGFGTPNHELWFGNDKLHSLTAQKPYELRIDFVNGLGDPYYAKYSSFSINDENDNYRLILGSYSEGNAGSQMHHNNGTQFTTRDRDHDTRSDVNCAIDSEYSLCGSRCHWNAGWWYTFCGNAFLNSPYGSGCFFWRNLPGRHCNIKFTEMKLRPI